MLGDATRSDQITVYLKRLSSGDTGAESLLADAVYAQMRHIAKGVLKKRSAHLSLQPTSLANEVLLECARLRTVDWQDRKHFYRTAARMIRRKVIDHIRQQQAAKRPPSNLRTELDEFQLPTAERFDQILFVNEGLEHLAQFDAKLAELVEMIYFGGLTIAEAAKIRGVSEKTIDRHLELARRWLKLRMRQECPSFAAQSAISGV